MGEFDLFGEQLEKFNGLLAENGLIGKFKPAKYPIEVEIERDMIARGQTSMFDDEEDKKLHRETKIVLRFPIGAVTVQFVGKIIIAEKTLNKIKSQAKKLHDLYLQGFFASEKGRFEEE
ncbi:MAG: hypothetical protein IJF32_05880 [Oscillospiraceae bacterium]|nr:hypothetical protein [Oscillospiraceae bacterium]